MRRYLLVFLLLLLSVNSSCESDAEKDALLQIKASLSDPLNNLETWTSSATSPCQFSGVRCRGSSVTGISLSSMNLSGVISPSIAMLGELERLELDYNSLSGTVPTELISCTQLRFLNLSLNYLTGELPDMSPLTVLGTLDVANNNFSGRFPAWVGDMNSLVYLSIGMNSNSYYQGELPRSIGNLKNLTYLYLSSCSLSGEIPDSIFELTLLETLDLSMNNLAGEIPSAIGNLKNLWKIELYKNKLTGMLPPELGKLTKLRELDVSGNQLSGGIPAAFAELKSFHVIQLYRNNLSGEIPAAWGELRFLTSFSIYENRFSGDFPANFGRFSPLTSVDISENDFSGSFPEYLCTGKKLQFLLALQNGFSGEFPETYSSCTSLQRFRINDNKFTGSVPEGLWRLPAVTIIDISDNGFTGIVSPLISDAQNLNQLWAQNNRIRGNIPAGIGLLQQLQKLYLSNNSLSGSIPSQIGRLPKLTALHLEGNMLTGALPGEIGGCVMLVEIDVSGNDITGAIPVSLSLLTSLNSLNVSGNLFSGTIPTELQSLKLSSVDFSANRLTGNVPRGLLMLAGDEAFAGNPSLCVNGWSEVIGRCSVDDGHGESVARKTLVLVLVLVSAMLLLVAGILVISYRSFMVEEMRRKRDDVERCDEQWKLESFHPPELDADEICGVGEENLIGTGGNGRVYRLKLKDGCGTVAVKRLRKGDAARVMAAEMAILGVVRHRNILKLHACMSRGELNFIVYEYMPRGNLYQALRREYCGELDWPRRLNIAVGAAKGIMYLHHDCTPAVIHRDIKSTNILLDEDYEARIADFGIARITADDDESTCCFAGTHGYLAPELAYSLKVTEKTDVYSFGVVLLELVTGRSPIGDRCFGEGKDIVFWVSTKLGSEPSMDDDDILDTRLEVSSARRKEEMLKVLKIAMLCTGKLPAGRPTMRDVVKMLTDASCSSSSTHSRMVNKSSC